MPGRWDGSTSPDPGNAGADLYNPQSWNGYAYVLNNPLVNVDPSGMDCVTFDNGSTGDDGQGQACAGSQTAYQLEVSGSTNQQVSSWWWWWWTHVGEVPGNSGNSGGGGATNGGDASSGGGQGGSQTATASDNPPPPTKSGTQTCASNKGGSIWTGTVTFPLTSAGAFLGSLAGPEGTLPGALFGSMFGFGGTASYVPSTHSIYVGVTIQAGLAINGGSGGSINVVNVPAGQNPNSIANGQSYSVAYQPRPFAGSTVTKSPGSGGPVVGPSVGSKVPVSGSASYNMCLWNCGCGG